MNRIKSRNSNLELLRIVAMIFIVLHHFIVHGFQLSKLQGGYQSVFPVNSPVLSYEFLISNSFFIVGVNLFILISGYFSIKLRWRGIINLLIICLFYDYMQLYAADIYYGQRISMHWEPLTGVFTRSGWFIVCYMALMLLSPGINAAIESFSNKQRSWGVIVLFVLNFWFGFYQDEKLINESGYSMMQFILMYYIGRMLFYSDSRLKKTAAVYALGYLLVSVILSAVVIYQFNTKDYVSMWELFHYNNPLIVLSAVLLFLTFKNIRIESKAINFVSSSILAVYLLHESDFLRKIIHRAIQKTVMEYGYISLHSMLIFTGIFLAIMTGSILIDKVRMILTNPLTEKLTIAAEKAQSVIETKIRSLKWR